jgi:hypothetical protein
MNKLETAVISAIRARRNMRESNMEVTQGNDGCTVLLHGNAIARIMYSSRDGIDSIKATFAGWLTSVTSRRLDAIAVACGIETCHVRIKKGNGYILRRDGSSFPVASDEWFHL